MLEIEEYARLIARAERIDEKDAKREKRDWSPAAEVNFSVQSLLNRE